MTPVEKKKMSNSKFRKIFIPIVAVLVVIAISGTIAANVFAASLDTYLGRGARRVSSPNGTGKKDANYYDKKFTTTSDKDGSVAYAVSVSKKITDEGEVLMKNNGALPLAKKSKVTPFGYRYISPVYGGTGSGNVDASKDYIATPEKALAKYFDVNSTVVDKMKKSTPKDITSKEIKDFAKSTDEKSFSGISTSITEFDPKIYDDTASSVKGTKGIVFLGRAGGEGGNLQTTAYADGTKHELELTTYELDTIKFAKQNCDKVIAVIDSSNVMELGPIVSGDYAVDAIIWIGGPGSTGFDSLADILAGEVNPSGRTADIWDANLFSNPATANFSDRTYTNTKNTQIASNCKGLYFIEYEEGVYNGYRYFETASDLGFLDYNKAVVYPFGHGLSYTTFEQSIKSFSNSGDKITATVQVKNTGKVDGKEVVQLYYTAPYTDFDKQSKIEKPTKNLIAFEKVDVKAGETKEVTININKEDMASYCYTHENSDGSKGSWVLEKGDYKISLGKNSHDAWDTKTANISSTIWYNNEKVRQSEVDGQAALDNKGNPLGYPEKANEDKNAKYVAATNQFEDSSAYMNKEATILSRSDWKATQPSVPQEKALSAERLEKASNFDIEKDSALGNNSNSKAYAKEDPVSKANNGLTLSDMRGKSYYDKSWNSLLDQIDYGSDQLSKLLYVSAFTTGELSSVGKPKTVDHDGPQGWGLTGAKGGPLTTAYSSEVVVASTWNKDLAYDYGKAIGQEALVIGYTGWYGPGLNIHRSPFNGRNFEYYSEDPLLSGKLAARCISGAADQGVLSYLKHFALDDYEGPSTALAVWATEQTIREIYLKPFETAVKESRMTMKYISDNKGTVSTKTMRACNGIMASATLVNGEWCSSNYNLLTNVLRGEWGFQGVVSTDMFLENSPNIIDKVFRAGADLRMWFMPGATATDMKSATAKTSMRRAIKNICYAYVNSNLMQGTAPGSIISYSMSPWAIGLTIFDALAGVFCLAMIAIMIRRTQDEKKHPEKYNVSKKQTV